MSFTQAPPSLGNTYESDPVLRTFLENHLPAEVLREIEPSLREMGSLSGGPLHELLREDEASVPVLTSWDPWGRRIDRIELTRLWKETLRMSAEKGLVAIPYERRHGPYSRLHQFALVHLFEPSSGVTSCPLAMTDGAAKTLLTSGNADLAARALPRLTARDPARAWTSGQWMTERIGGSDVAESETVARLEGDTWRLYGTKWFTSATTSEMALTLARPEGNPPGGKGLALFYLETRDEAGDPNGLAIHRLKDKLGTRMLPTAELDLVGARAVPVKGLSNGVKNITTMLNMTRTWNAVAAVSGMRRALDLARDYAAKRVAFGAPLSEKPLHARDSRGPRGALRRGVPPHVPGRRAPRARGKRRSLGGRGRAPPAPDADREADDGKAGHLRRERGPRGVRRRRIHREHRPSTPSQRRSGPAALGRDDERPRPRPPPGAHEGRRARSRRARGLTMPRGSRRTARSRGPERLGGGPARGRLALPRPGHDGARGRRAAVRPDGGPRPRGRAPRRRGLAPARRTPFAARGRALRPLSPRFDPGRRAARGGPGASRSRRARPRRARALTASRT